MKWLRLIRKLKPYNIQKGLRYLKHYGVKEFLIRLSERMEPEEVPYLSLIHISSGLRRVGIRYFTWLIHLLTGKTITDPTSGLRMVNRSVIQQYASCYPKDYPEPESVVTTVSYTHLIMQ